MKTIQLKHKKWPNLYPLTLTIGNFDGTHLGHQQLIKNVRKFSDTNSAALTFSPHPTSYLTKNKVNTLMSDNEKIEEFKNYGLTYMLIAEFNKDFASLTAEEFIQNLKDLGVIRLVLGRDFQFGNKAEGTVEDLRKHFEVAVLRDVLYNETRVSTTFIKALLDEAKLDIVNQLLNKNYHVSGYVEQGNKIGQTLGFRTANVNYGNYYLPKNGVYFVEVLVDNDSYYGVANIGNNPTINYTSKRKLEAHIMDFENNIYDKPITIIFKKYLRDEKKFSSKTELIKQLNIDKMETQDIINKRNMLK